MVKRVRNNTKWQAGEFHLALVFQYLIRFSLELLTCSTRTRQLRSLCTYGTSTCSMVDVRLLRVSTPMRYIFTYRTSATAPIGYYLSPVVSQHPIYLFYHVCSNEFFVQGMYERGGRVAYCVRTSVYVPTGRAYHYLHIHTSYLVEFEYFY